MKPALAVLAVVLLVLWVWWGRGEERARSTRAAPPGVWEEPAPDVPEQADATAAPEAPPLPPDPVEHGECALLLHVVDAETEQPVASTVDLWRLDAPGNADWTEGDQLHLTAKVSADGLSLDALPAGVYRPVCLAARFSDEDPPPMRVAGPLTEVTVRIAMPRRIRARLRVVDLRGELVPEGRVRQSTRTWRDRERVPTWARPRAPRSGPLPSSGLGGGGGGGTGGWHRDAIPQPAHGFEIGPFDEDSKASAVKYRVTVGVDGQSTVDLVVPGAAGDGQVYLGLSVPTATLTGDLRMPDGRTIAEAAGQVWVSFPAVALDPFAPPPLLADVPFHLTVRVPECVALSFERRLGDPPPAVVLKPALVQPTRELPYPRSGED